MSSNDLVETRSERSSRFDEVAEGKVRSWMGSGRGDANAGRDIALRCPDGAARRPYQSFTSGYGSADLPGSVQSSPRGMPENGKGRKRLKSVAEVERVVLNALATKAALPFHISAFGEQRIAFGEADPPEACGHLTAMTDSR
jgi:hypothetical protein